jgi:RNA polymerase sigma factor (sigma-70 family)
VPGYQRRRLREIRDAEFELRAELGRRPDENELSARLGRSVSRVRHTIGRRQYEIRIDTPAGEDGNATWAQRLEDRDAVDPEVDLLRGELREQLQRELDCLESRELDILRWRFGLDDEPVRSLQEVSERVGLSRERVRQIEVEVKRRLRRRLSRSRLAPVG